MEGSRTLAPTFALKQRPRDMLYFKTKTVWQLPSLAPCELFVQQLHTLILPKTSDCLYTYRYKEKKRFF